MFQNICCSGAFCSTIEDEQKFGVLASVPFLGQVGEETVDNGR